ncbi:hypothetical protein HBN50_16435 [Halobacteriovorax sp. GB3]|nr:hypothetical protein [Halobacteriovorax sp. GB3]
MVDFGILIYILLSILPFIFLPFADGLVFKSTMIEFKFVDADYSILLGLSITFLLSIFPMILIGRRFEYSLKKLRFKVLWKNLIIYSLFFLSVMKVLLIQKISLVSELVNLQSSFTDYNAILHPIAMFAFFFLIPVSTIQTEDEYQQLVCRVNKEKMAIESIFTYISKEITTLFLLLLFVTVFFGGYQVLPGLTWLTRYGDIALLMSQTLSLVIKVFIGGIAVEWIKTRFKKVVLFNMERFVINFFVPILISIFFVQLIIENYK